LYAVGGVDESKFVSEKGLKQGMLLGQDDAGEKDIL